MIEPAPPGVEPALPPELESRIAALEHASGKDFDARSLGWMVLLGVIVPLLLIVIGYYA